MQWWKNQRSFSIVHLFLLQNAEPSGDAFHVGDNFLLHQIEAHGEQCDTEQQIQRAQGDGNFGIVFHSLRWDEITESCRGDREKERKEKITLRMLLVGNCSE